MGKAITFKLLVILILVFLNTYYSNAQVASIESFSSGWANQTLNTGTQDQVYMFHFGASVSSATVTCFGSAAGRNSVRPDSNGDYFEVQLNFSGTTKLIDQVSFNVTANGTTASHVGHYGWSTDGINWVHGAQFILPITSLECALYTVAAPLDGNYKYFRIMRNSTSTNWAGTNGGGQTIRIYSMRVWTKSSCSPVTIFNVSGTTTICSGSSTNVTLSESQDGVSYQLFAGASSSGSPVAGTGGDLFWSVSPTSTTTYTVRTTSTGGFCETTMTGNAVITVNQPPTPANAGEDINLTLPTVSTSLAANTASIGTGSWSVVSGPSTNTSQFSSLSSPTATFTADGGAGTYVLRWTISNSPCAPSADDVSVIIASATVPTISKTSGANNQTVAAVTSIQNIVYTWAGTATSASFTWTGSSVTTPSGIIETSDNENKTITLSGTPTAAGTYNFSVRSTDESQNSVPLTGTLTVKLPVPSISDATSRTNQGFTANWSDISGESGYKINVYQGVNLVKVESGIAANATSVAISGLNANTTYTYRVVAVGNGTDIPDSDESVASNSVRTLNTATAITAFSIPGQISSVIDQVTFSITVRVPQNTVLSSLTPTLTLSAHASVNPGSGVSQDFSSAVQYVVTAEDGEAQQTYTVNVMYASQTTDHFRTKANGIWNTAANWESSINNVEWINATSIPESAAQSVIIDHNITVNNPVETSDVTVNQNKKLILSPGGSLSVSNGKSLVVNGVLENSIFSTSSPFAGPGSIIINGTYDLTASPTANAASDATHIPIATWGISSTCRISGIIGANEADYTQLRGVNQSFNIFEINTPNLVGKILIQGTEVFGSATNFVVNSTGIGTSTRQGIQLSTSTSGRTGMTVHNYTQNAGLVHIVSNSSNTVGRSFTVNGDFVLNGGIFNVAQYTTNGATTSLTLRGNLTVANGTILQKDLTTTGSGNFGNVSIIFDGNSLITDNGNIRDLNVITVNSGRSITLSAGGKLSGNSPITNNGTINLNSDATGTATIVAAVTGSGTATVQQHLTSGRNWYFASPVSNATSNVIRATAGNQLWERNVAGNSWTAITATDVNLTPGRGYIGKVAETGVITFNGTLNNGQIQYPISSHAVSSGKFHLVGNPYASYLDWQTVVANNPGVMPTMWYRTKSATNAYIFATVLMSDGIPIVSAVNAASAVTKFIPPMQGFWVRIDDSVESTNFTVNNTMRSHADQSGNRFKAPANRSQMLRLEISNSTNNDETVVYFNANATDAFDRYDAPKMFNNIASIPEIYTRAGNERLVINGMNSYNFNTMIPLGFVAGQAGSFSIRSSELQNFDSDTQVYLLDKTNNSQFNLTTGESYSFTSDATSTEDRFAVLFKSSSGVTSAAETLSGMYLYSQQGRLTLQMNTAIDNARVTVYTATGQNIHSQIIHTNTTQLHRNLDSGLYLVKVENAGKTVVFRTIVK